MNNEERIIEMLTTILARLDTLETGQANLTAIADSMDAKVMRLEASVAELKVNQAEIKATQVEILHEVKAIREQTGHLAEFEAEMRLNFKSLKGVTRINTFDIAELKAAAIM